MRTIRRHSSIAAPLFLCAVTIACSRPNAQRTAGASGASPSTSASVQAASAEPPTLSQVIQRDDFELPLPDGYADVTAAMQERSPPREALAILQRPRESVSLVLTDIVMPEMDGRTLAARAIEIRPELRVVFMSGYTEHPAVSHAPFGPDEHLIRKPFTPQELARGVRTALDGSLRAAM